MAAAAAMESVSMDAAMAGIAISLLAPLSIAVCAALSARSFRGRSSRAIMVDAGLIALLPPVVFLLLTMVRAEPNVHGGVIFGIVLWVPLSELCALSLMIAVGIRRIRARRQPAID